MSKYKETIGYHNGSGYLLKYDKRGHQMACDEDCYHEWRWFLWVKSKYVGDFKTKTLAMRMIIER
jgi:hypothetical protein